MFCKAFHTIVNRIPILNGEEIDELVREALALRYLTSYSWDSIKQIMLKVGFEIIPLDKVRKNSSILVGSRYRESVAVTNSSFDMVQLGEVTSIIRGVTFPKNAQKTNEDVDSLKVITTKAAQASGIDFKKIIHIDKSYIKPEKLVIKDDILISLANSLDLVGRVTYVDADYSALTSF